METNGILTTEQIDKFRSENRNANISVNENTANELSLKSMLISCFTYGSVRKGSYYYEKYIKEYEVKLGKKTFDEVYDEMVKSFENYEIIYGVYTNSEDCTYNELKLKE